MPPPLNIGLIGLDTSHAPAFSRLLNDSTDEHYLGGGRAVVAYPGGTPGWEKSAGRVEGFTRQVRDDYGVEILDSPEAVAERVDLVIINACDGRAHRELFERVVHAGKPTFIDKPFAASLDDAQAMVRLAQQQGVTLMGCSPLRYAERFTAALGDDQHGAIKGIDVFGPMALDDALPGLFWYGCHSVEMTVTAMGVGCREVRAVAKDAVDVYTLIYDDDRVATIRGIREGAHRFGATLHRAEGFQAIDVSAGTVPFYATLLRAVLDNLPQGRSDVPSEQMLEVVAIMEAGNQARRSGRAEVADLAVA